MKKLILSASLIFTLALTGCGSDSSKPTETVKKVSLEEQSKQFIDENLEGKTIVDFTNRTAGIKVHFSFFITFPLYNYWIRLKIDIFSI